MAESKTTEVTTAVKSDAHFIRAGTAPVHGSGGLEMDEFLLTAANTSGRMALVNSTLQKGAAAPWHVHKIDHEIFYVITGQLKIGVGNKVYDAGPGDVAVAGPGVPRCYRALQDSRILSINLPGGPSEAFLQAVLAQKEGPPSKELQAELYEKYKIRIIDSKDSPSGFNPFEE